MTYERKSGWFASIRRNIAGGSRAKARQTETTIGGPFPTRDEAQRCEDNWWADPANVTYAEWLSRHRQRMQAGVRYAPGPCPEPIKGRKVSIRQSESVKWDEERRSPRRAPRKAS